MIKTIVLIWLQTLLNASKNYVKKSWNIRHKWALILNATSTSPQPRPDPFGPLTVDQYIYVTLCKGRYPKKYPPPPSPKKGVKESLVRFNWALSPNPLFLFFCFMNFFPCLLTNCLRAEQITLRTDLIRMDQHFDISIKGRHKNIVTFMRGWRGGVVGKSQPYSQINFS